MRNRILIIGVAFFAASAILRFLAVNQSEHPSGWDGYYYVMQVHSWMTFGHMQSPDFSLIYPFFVLTTFISSDPIIGFKIGVALISALLTIAVYYYLIRRNVAFAMICLACSYIAFSPLITYFILQFPKNAFGLVFFILFMNSLKKPNVWTAVLFICTLLVHRMTGAFALIGIGLYSIKFVPWKWILAGVLVVITLGFLPGILHISDLARFDGQLTSTPHWAPIAFMKIFPTSLNWLFRTDLVLISLMIVTCLVMVVRNPKRISLEAWIWFALAIISMFPFLSFVAGDLGHRFFMIAPVVLMIFISLQLNPQPLPLLALTGVFIVLSFFSFRSYKPWAFDAPNEIYVQITESLKERFSPDNFPLIIAHKGLAEVIIFKTDFDALNWLPPQDIPKDKVLRITQSLRSNDFKKYLDDYDYNEVSNIARNYFTIPETTWNKFVAAAKASNNKAVLQRIYGGNNPMDQRPYFIGKGKK